jgi:hypothetical protein
MRARHRHFNAKSAGAVFVVDSRYITGLSDGNAVSTWSDRSGNGKDATMPTGANQPTYETAEQGGQPVVKFDGVNDFLETASPATTVTNNWAMFSVAKTLTRVSGGYSGHFQMGGDSGGGQSHRNANGNFGGLYGGVAWLNDGPAKLDQWIIQSFLRTSGTAQFWANGITTGTTFTQNPSTPANRTFLATFTGVGTQQCEISTAVITNVAIGASLRKRIEHAAAYSFKIACS